MALRRLLHIPEFRINNALCIIPGTLLGLLGFAVNHFGSIELIPGIALLFGSICSLFALFRYGLFAGLIASLISSSYSSFIFNHHWGIFLLTAEILAIWLITRRTRIDPVIALILFWIVAGGLFSMTTLKVFLGFSWQDAALVMLKQFVNGVLNALIAKLLHLGVKFRIDTQRETVSMRRLLFYLTGIALTAPIMFYTATDIRKEYRKQLAELAADTAHVSSLATSLIVQLTAEAEQVGTLFRTLAEGTDDLSNFSTLLIADQLLRKDGIVNRVLILDAKNRLVAYKLRQGVAFPLAVGHDFSDHPFIRQLRSTTDPFVSGLFWSKEDSATPRIGLMLALHSNGRYQGALICSLDLGLLKRILSDISGTHALRVTLLDRFNQVVVSTRPDLHIMQRLATKYDVKHLEPDGLAVHIIPADTSIRTPFNRQQRSFYRHESDFQHSVGWKLLVEAPLQPVTARAASALFHTFLLLSSLLMLTLLFAFLVSRSMTGALARLSEVAEKLLVTGNQQESAVYPTSHIAEVQLLASDLKRIHHIAIERANELNSSHAKLQQLSEHLAVVGEEERKEIARELHDELGTSLTALRFDTAWLKRRIGTGDQLLHERLSSIETTIQLAVDTVRRIIAELRPWMLDELGLSATLEWYLQKLQTRTGITCLLKTAPSHDTLPLDNLITKDQAVNLYRITQEATTNSIRHADATHIRVSLAYNRQQLELEIADDGKGFSADDPVPAKRTYGLTGMQERARLLSGTFAIASQPGHGTIIRLVMPLAAHPEG